MHGALYMHHEDSLGPLGAAVLEYPRTCNRNRPALGVAQPGSRRGRSRGSDALRTRMQAAMASWLALNLTLSTPRSRLAAAAVDNLVVFAGGLGTDGTPSAVVDVFDLGRGGKRTTLQLSVARDFDGGQNMGAVLGSRAYFGGGAEPAQSAAVDIFDASKMRVMTPPPPLSSGRSFLATVALPAAGLVLFGGGENAEDEKHPEASRDSDTVDVWSAREERWLPPMRLSWPRKKLAATAVENGSVAIFAGGYTSDSNHSNCGSPAVRPGMGCYRRRLTSLTRGRARGRRPSWCRGGCGWRRRASAAVPCSLAAR